MSTLTHVGTKHNIYHKQYVWDTKKFLSDQEILQKQKNVCSFGHILGSVPALRIFQHSSPYLLSLLIVEDYIHWTVDSLHCISFGLYLMCIITFGETNVCACPLTLTLNQILLKHGKQHFAHLFLHIPSTLCDWGFCILAKSLAQNIIKCLKMF